MPRLTPPHSAVDYLDHCLRAIRRLDAPALTARAGVVIPTPVGKVDEFTALVAGYRSALDEIGAIHPPDLAELRSQRRLLRRKR